MGSSVGVGVVTGGGIGMEFGATAEAATTMTAGSSVGTETGGSVGEGGRTVATAGWSTERSGSGVGTSTGVGATVVVGSGVERGNGSEHATSKERTTASKSIGRSFMAR